MRVLFLVNPNARGGAANEKPIGIAWDIFSRAGWEIIRVNSRSENHAADEISSAKANGYELVIVAGGDGTVHHAIQYIPLVTPENPEPIPLGIFPLGSGNDFIRGTGAPHDPEGAAKNLVDGKSVPFDIGLVEPIDEHGNLRDGRIVRFCNTAGVGIDSQTLATRLKAPKWLGTRYDLLFVWTLLTLYPLKVSLEAEEWKYEGDLYWALCANNHQIGNGMKIAPGALIDDGEMDIVLVKKTSKLQFIGQLPKVFKGTHVELDVFEMRKAKSVILRCIPEQKVAADGDITEFAPCRIQILKHAARLWTSWIGGRKIGAEPRVSTSGFADG